MGPPAPGSQDASAYAPPVAPDDPAPKPRTKKNGLTSAQEKAVLEEARDRLKRALDADSGDRKRAQDELRFVWNADNCQWDDEAKKARKSRPMLTENRNPSFVRQATNAVRQSRPQVRVLPVDGQGDVYTAQIFEGLIRNIEANSRADLAYDGATDQAAFCGRGYWKVCTEYQSDGFEQDIIIEPVPDSFAIVDDPDCAFPDKSDRKFAFEIEKVPKTEYKSQYGYDAKEMELAIAALGDHASNWIDGESIVVANYWRVSTESETIYLMDDGQIVPDAEKYIAQLASAHAQTIAAVKAMGGMGAPIPMEFTPPAVKQQRELITRKVEWFCIDGVRAHSKGEWSGQFIPLIYTTCEQVKVDGKWMTKGMTYDAQDLTKANNYLLSAQIENIALTPKQPFIGPKGSFKSDRAKWNTINADAFPFVEYDVQDAEGKPLPAPTRAPGVTAQPEISQVRMGVIDGQRAVVGLMGASLGDGGPEVAYKAIEARQVKGDTAVFHVMDNLVRAVRYGGMVLVDLIPRVYDSKRVVRIINPDSSPQMVAINQMFVDQQTGQTRTIDFSKGKYDVTVSAGPAFETQRQRDNALMVDLAGKIPAMATAVPDLLAKNLLSGPDGDKIAQRLARTVSPEIMGTAPSPQVKGLQQQLQGLQQQMHELSTQKDFFESELAKQKSLVEKAGIDSQTAGVKLQSTIATLQSDLEQSRLEVQKKDLEVQKAELALARATMPAPLAAHAAPFTQ